ncbi:MAG: DEAD/DEAH box helicase, partial [Bdellovibrionaceae bacterium]|nr:DEAD/DEAH box helicase [Pseudobdellovibrionaceae bacterium]
YCALVTPTIEKSHKVSTYLQKLLEGTNLKSRIAENAPPFFFDDPPQFIIGIPRRIRDLIENHQLDPKQARAILLLDGDKLSEFNLLDDVNFFIKRTYPSSQLIIFQNQTEQNWWSNYHRPFRKVYLSDPDSQRPSKAIKTVRVLKCNSEAKISTLIQLFKSSLIKDKTLIVTNEPEDAASALAQQLTQNGIVTHYLDQFFFKSPIKQPLLGNTIVTTDLLWGLLGRIGDNRFHQIIFLGIPNIPEVWTEIPFILEFSNNSYVYLIGDHQDEDHLMQLINAQKGVIASEPLVLESQVEPLPSISDPVPLRQDRVYYKVITELIYRYTRGNRLARQRHSLASSSAKGGGARLQSQIQDKRLSLGSKIHLHPSATKKLLNRFALWWKHFFIKKDKGYK